MLNINELEQRWLKYKMKSYIPHVIIIISLLAIFTIMVILFTKEENTYQKQTLKINTKIIETKIKKIEPILIKESVKPIIKIKEEKVYVQENIQESVPSSKKISISPSLDFMKKMQDNTLSNYEDNSAYQPTTKPIKTPINYVQEQKIQVPVKQDPPKIEEEVQSIRIKRQNTHDDISQVISRFNKNNNPALSLFIAKKYYELGDYHKSYNYALITNEINSGIEASWIVFAKSLVKLNEKELAIKTLKKYISQSNSNRANILLDEITSGKFK